MIHNQVFTPTFATEGEEADWWGAHPEVATDRLRRAIDSGKTEQTPSLRDLPKAKGLPTNRA